MILVVRIMAANHVVVMPWLAPIDIKIDRCSQGDARRHACPGNPRAVLVPPIYTRLRVEIHFRVRIVRVMVDRRRRATNIHAESDHVRCGSRRTRRETRDCHYDDQLQRQLLRSFHDLPPIPPET
jgi:hypothetical protein